MRNNKVVKEIFEIEKILKDENNQTFFLFCHENPDGDALGGVFAMKFLIEKYYSNFSKKRIIKICLTEKNRQNISKSYFFLPTLKDFIENENNSEDSKSFANNKIKGDVAIFIETSNVKRAGFSDENLEVKTIINIDHHKINDFFGQINWVDSKKAAVCEMVYIIYKQLGKKIDLKTALCLYTGILTDTGRFQYSNMKIEIYDIIKGLVKKGIDINFVYTNIYGSKTKNNIFFMKELLNNLEFFNIEKISFAFSFVDENFIQKNSIKHEDMEGATDYLRDIENVDIAIFAKPKMTGIFKFSMRARGNFAVDKLSAIFDGGGHKFAAGFDIKADNILNAKKIVLEKITGTRNILIF